MASGESAAWAVGKPVGPRQVYSNGGRNSVGRIAWGGGGVAERAWPPHHKHDSMGGLEGARAGGRVDVWRAGPRQSIMKGRKIGC